MLALSMNEMTTYRWSFEEDVARYREAGFGAIGVWRQKLSDFGEEKGIELLDDAGLQVSNLLWAGGFTGSEGRSFRDSVEDGLEAVRLAGELKAAALVVYSGARNSHTHNHARRLLKSALKEMAVLAGELRVQLALEPMHPDCAENWTFLTGLDATLEIIEEAALPRPALVLDTYHLGFDETLPARIPSLVDDIALVHLGDGRLPTEGEQNRCLLGEGHLPLAQMVQALIAGGYSGYFDVELIGQELETADYRQVLLHSLAAFDKLAGVEAS